MLVKLPLLTKIVYHINLIKTGLNRDKLKCVVPENIHTTPREGIGFSRGEGRGQFA